MHIQYQFFGKQLFNIKSKQNRAAGNGTRDCELALQLSEDISNMQCEHDCFASCFHAARLFDY